jgi:Zn-dependent protease with chaperone function
LKKGAGAPQYRIVFRRLGVPNAFALPGGCIVVADEIVALAPQDDAALLTVLGHELGHLQERHGMRGIVRASLFSAVAAWYLGDISGVAAGAAAGFTSLSYSRGAEQSADRYALRLMHDNGISTRPAAELFRRLADLQPDRTAGSTVAPGRGAEMPEYLSTHSDVRGRIALFENEDTEPAAAAAAKPR